PQAHTRRGIDFSTVINGLHDAVVDAQNRYGISIGLIMSFLRDLPEESAMQTLEEAMQYRKWILGVGLDSKELGNPPEKFERVFKKARDEGFIAVAHAGEEGPAEYVWSTIKLLKVARVDHGYHIFEDQELIRYIVSNRIPVTMCPLAAVSVKYYNNIVDLPIIKALNSGIIVSINSDDPAYFGGYVNQNYNVLQVTFKLSDKKITELAKLSVISSFMDEQSKQKIINEINTLS
ncbi:MAG: adenosine deaminase, partial [Nitrososphaeria archaeon]